MKTTKKKNSIIKNEKKTRLSTSELNKIRGGNETGDQIDEVI